jgi:effector-binding domain-containing protein
MNKKTALALLLFISVLLSAVLVGPAMSDVETPNYEIIRKDNNIEVRRYNPMIIALVQMQGQRKEISGDGFRILADYIFGNNTVQKDIAMTAPVQQQSSKKIAMTAPVQYQPENEEWNISFVMPSEYSIKDLPKPNNDRVTIKEIPAKDFAVIRFSGTSSDENVKKHEEKLMQYIIDNKIEITGAPKYAFYNPPWTLPPMRRNEVMIELK